MRDHTCSRPDQPWTRSSSGPMAGAPPCRDLHVPQRAPCSAAWRSTSATGAAGRGVVSATTDASRPSTSRGPVRGAGAHDILLPATGLRADPGGSCFTRDLAPAPDRHHAVKPLTDNVFKGKATRWRRGPGDAGRIERTRIPIRGRSAAPARVLRRRGRRPARVRPVTALPRPALSIVDTADPPRDSAVLARTVRLRIRWFTPY